MFFWWLLYLRKCVEGFVVGENCIGRVCCEEGVVARWLTLILCASEILVFRKFLVWLREFCFGLRLFLFCCEWREEYCVWCLLVWNKVKLWCVIKFLFWCRECECFGWWKGDLFWLARLVVVWWFYIGLLFVIFWNKLLGWFGGWIGE